LVSSQNGFSTKGSIDYNSVLEVLANLASKFPVLLIRDVYAGSWIPDPNFFHLVSRILDQNFFHPGSLIPDLNFFHPGCAGKNKKNGFSALRNMIRVFHPGTGSRIWILTFYLSWIPDPESRDQKGTGSLIPDPGSGFATLEISSLLRL
jgi:hypothetical protein